MAGKMKTSGDQKFAPVSTIRQLNLNKIYMKRLEIDRQEQS